MAFTRLRVKKKERSITFSGKGKRELLYLQKKRGWAEGHSSLNERGKVSMLL